MTASIPISGRHIATPEIPPLEQGDHLDQKTFHARYKATPEKFKAELIGGIVYVPSPLKARHGQHHGRMMGWLGCYQAETPGTEFFDNTTTILGAESEPQPDGCLSILPESGGQTWEDEEGYLAGAPEWIGEVASSSESYDLYEKKVDYEQAGVQEYLVLIVREERAVWFVRKGKAFDEMAPGDDGILRSRFFSGLWLDAAALFRGDTTRVLEVLRQGLALPDHAQFVAKLKRP
jgi:Uma2 family endonuclease